jgi:hypothetical protein
MKYHRPRILAMPSYGKIQQDRDTPGLPKGKPNWIEILRIEKT